MATSVIQSLGSFSVGRKTASANTAFAVMVPPYGGGGQAPGVGNVGLPGGGASKPRALAGVPHITSLIIDAGSTIHSLAIMRPLNYTWLAADAAASQAVLVVAADPGVYTTNFNYPLENGLTAPDAGNNVIAANDYVVYQAATGRWVLDTVASVSGTSITMTANVPTGGAKAGALFYFFGVSTDTDPSTGLAHMLFDTTASARLSPSDPNGLFCALHPGDPLVVYDGNATAADILQLVSGYYSIK